MAWKEFLVTVITQAKSTTLLHLGGGKAFNWEGIRCGLSTTGGGVDGVKNSGVWRGSGLSRFGIFDFVFNELS